MRVLPAHIVASPTRDVIIPGAADRRRGVLQRYCRRAHRGQERGPGAEAGSERGRFVVVPGKEGHSGARRLADNAGSGQ
jgi:hypothetical protein